MRNSPFRPILLLAVLVASILTVACNGNKKSAQNVAKDFLQSYYVDLDFEKAIRLSSDVSHGVIADQAELIAFNPYAKDEIPDIKFKALELDSDNPNTASCIYTCNRTERKLPLRKLNGKWLVDLGGKTVETAGSESDFFELAEGNNGFSSATSGEITYRKRRQGNN